MNNQGNMSGEIYAGQEVFDVVLIAGKSPVEQLSMRGLDSLATICGGV